MYIYIYYDRTVAQNWRPTNGRSTIHRHPGWWKLVDLEDVAACQFFPKAPSGRPEWSIINLHAGAQICVCICKFCKYIYIFIYLYIHIHIKQIYQIYSYNFLHMPNLIKIACLVLDSLLAGHPHRLKETSASSHKWRSHRPLRSKMYKDVLKYRHLSSFM